MKRHFVILPLATAVAALATTSRKSEAAASPMPPEPGAQERAEAATRPADQKPNVIFSSGEDLLGLIVTRAADSVGATLFPLFAFIALITLFALFQRLLSMADEIVVEFHRRTHSLDAVRAAAYRLIGRATCKIDATDDSFICHLEPVVFASQRRSS
jgi:hypothetical protein